MVCLYFGNTRSFKANGQVDLSSKFGTAEKGRNTFVILCSLVIFIDSHSNKRSGKSANCQYYLPCQCTNLFWISIESYLVVSTCYIYTSIVVYFSCHFSKQLRCLARAISPYSNGEHPGKKEPDWIWRKLSVKQMMPSFPLNESRSCRTTSI